MKTLCYMYLLCYMLFYMPGPFISMTISTASEVDASALILVRILKLDILPSLSTLNKVKYGPLEIAYVLNVIGKTSKAGKSTVLLT